LSEKRRAEKSALHPAKAGQLDPAISPTPSMHPPDGTVGARFFRFPKA